MGYMITDDCTVCGTCADECPIDAIDQGDDIYIIDQQFCTDCGACSYVCDAHAIKNEWAE
jgi:MinD superfamily P-loop ATPase